MAGPGGALTPRGDEAVPARPRVALAPARLIESLGDSRVGYTECCRLGTLDTHTLALLISKTAVPKLISPNQNSSAAAAPVKDGALAIFDMMHCFCNRFRDVVRRILICSSAAVLDYAAIVP